MVEKPRIEQSESNHYYDYEGIPVTEVPRADIKRVGTCPKCHKWCQTTAKLNTACKSCGVKISVEEFEQIRLKPTTDKEAKKYGLFLSVSRIAGYGEFPIELSNWMKTLYAEATMDTYIKGYETNRERWMREVSKLGQERENVASTFGTVMHGWIQRAILDEPIDKADPISRAACENVLDWMEREGIYPDYCIPERTFANTSYGVGGTIDVVNTSNALIMDWKTKLNPASYAWHKKGNASKTHIKQIVAYAALTDNSGCRMVLGYISQQTGEMTAVELTVHQVEWAWNSFRKNLAAIQANMNFYPSLMYEEGKCWTRDEILAGVRKDSSISAEGVAL